MTSLTVRSLVFLVSIGFRDAWAINCTESKHPTELLICQDEILLAADKEAGLLLDRAIQNFPDQKAAQDRWIAHIRDTCEDPGCIATAYFERISELERLIGDVRVIEPPLRAMDTASSPVNAPAAQAVSSENSVDKNVPASGGGESGELFEPKNFAERLVDALGPSGIALLLLSTAFVITLVSKIRGYLKKCPSCGARNAASVIQRNQVGTRVVNKEVTLKSIHKDRHGTVTGSTNRTEIVPTTRVTIEEVKQCKFCKHAWSRLVEE